MKMELECTNQTEDIMMLSPSDVKHLLEQVVTKLSPEKDYR